MSARYVIAVSVCAAGHMSCAVIGGGNYLTPGGGIMMAYEVSGRVSSDESSCDAPLGEAPVALYDEHGVLLDQTKTDQAGKFNLGVRNPEAAEAMSAKLDQEDPTVPVKLRVQVANRGEHEVSLRLPRPVHAREFRVKIQKNKRCPE